MANNLKTQLSNLNVFATPFKHNTSNASKAFAKDLSNSQMNELIT